MASKKTKKASRKPAVSKVSKKAAKSRTKAQKKTKSAKAAPAARTGKKKAAPKAAKRRAAKSTPKAPSRAAKAAAAAAGRGGGKKPSAPASKPSKATKATEWASAAERLGVGDPAPDFELPDQHGDTVSSSELAGKPYVLYFYPKDDTPGCTREACGFRDDGSAFREAGVRVLGVSPDSVESHAKFADKFSLDFTLLSDTDKDLARAYGTWALKKNYGREYMGIERSTFLVGSDGKVKAAWRGVKVDGHIDKVLQAAQGVA